jgi:predicted ester cyclase
MADGRPGAHYGPVCKDRTGPVHGGCARADAKRCWGAFDTVSTAIHDRIAKGDKVVLHWSTTGRHTGRCGDVAATGHSITMVGIDILTLKDGRIPAVSSMCDGLSVFDQLRVLTIGTEPAP